jgi:Ser/Thr protein kinase RdoA (MazF antagonist)
MSEEVQVRPPIAMVSAAPHRDEVTTMVEELERQGQAVTLVCLDRSPHDHGRTHADVLHLPRLSAPIASSFVHRLLREPLRVLRAGPAVTHLARVLSGRGIVDVRGLDRAGTKIASAVQQLSNASPPDLTALPVDWSRLGAQRVGVRWLSRRINSIAAEASLDGDRRVIVKRQGAGKAAHEYAMLSSVATAMPGERLTVPRVLLFDGETIVMERARGTELEALFAAAAADRTKLPLLEAGLRGAGAWLAALQAATRRDGDGAALVADVVAAAVIDAKKLAAIESGFRRHYAAIVEGLETLRHRLSSRSTTLTGHHGDYFPGNVFFDGERVTVIDFEGFRDGLPLEDVAYFLLRTDLLRRRFRLPAQLTERFLEGYAPGQTLDGDALRLFTMSKGMRTLANGLGYDQPMPQRIWSRGVVRKAVLAALP